MPHSTRFLIAAIIIGNVRAFNTTESTPTIYVHLVNYSERSRFRIQSIDLNLPCAADIEKACEEERHTARKCQQNMHISDAMPYIVIVHNDIIQAS